MSDSAAGDSDVRVPDLVGLGWEEARAVGEAAGLWVSSTDPDGPPLPALGWPGGVVVRQEPSPGRVLGRGGRLTVWLGRGPGPAGVREPRRLPPTPGQLGADAAPDEIPGPVA